MAADKQKKKEVENKKIRIENYILTGAPGRLGRYAVEIVSKEAERDPGKFEGRKPYFFFELRYHPPFDKGFNELKRLQGTAAEAAGRRDEFCGYVIMDLSGFVTHEKEHYFDMTMYFLADMCDCWKYIFLIDNANEKAAKALMGRMLSILLRRFFCEVREIDEAASGRKVVDAVCAEQGAECTESVKDFFQDVLEIERNGADIIAVLLREATAFLGPQIGMQDLADFCGKREPVVKYMLSSKQYDRIMSVLKWRKEGGHDEREAV